MWVVVWRMSVVFAGGVLPLNYVFRFPALRFGRVGPMRRGDEPLTFGLPSGTTQNHPPAPSNEECVAPSPPNPKLYPPAIVGATTFIEWCN